MRSFAVRACSKRAADTRSRSSAPNQPAKKRLGQKSSSRKRFRWTPDVHDVVLTHPKRLLLLPLQQVVIPLLKLAVSLLGFFQCPALVTQRLLQVPDAILEIH